MAAVEPPALYSANQPAWVRSMQRRRAVFIFLYVAVETAISRNTQGQWRAGPRRNEEDKCSGNHVHCVQRQLLVNRENVSEH